MDLYVKDVAKANLRAFKNNLIRAVKISKGWLISINETFQYLRK
jgi:hypothetical protein